MIDMAMDGCQYDWHSDGFNCHNNNNKTDAVCKNKYVY